MKFDFGFGIGFRIWTWILDFELWIWLWKIICDFYMIMIDFKHMCNSWVWWRKDILYMWISVTLCFDVCADYGYGQAISLT